MAFAHLHMQDSPFRVKKTLCGVKVTRLGPGTFSTDVSQPKAWRWGSTAAKALKAFESYRRKDVLCAQCRNLAELLVLEQSL